jgi:hypothetical protein
MKILLMTTLALGGCALQAEGIIARELYKPEFKEIRGDRIRFEMVPLSGKSGAPFVQPKQYVGQRLNTQGNKVGIAQDDMCVIVGYMQLDPTMPIQDTIVCKSGKQFRNLKKETKSVDDRSYLSEKNYIGSYVKITPGPAGTGERVIYFQ